MPDMDDPRAAILAVSSRLLAEAGPDALSNRRIAREAGVTTMAIYSRFGSKGGILDALFDEGLERLGAAQEGVAPQVHPCAEVLALCRAYRHVALTWRGHYQLLFGDGIPGWQPSEALRRRARARFDRLAEGVGRAVEAGAAGPPELTAWALWVACHGHVSVELRGYAELVPDPAAAFDAVVLRILRVEAG